MKWRLLATNPGQLVCDNSISARSTISFGFLAGTSFAVDTFRSGDRTLLRRSAFAAAVTPGREGSPASMMDGNLSNIKKWNIIYPVYLNSKKTVADGRKIGAAKACENPTCAEISDCCNHLKIPCVVEPNKAYPRDFMQRGRVRVQLKKEDGSLYNPTIGSKKQLMIQVAELVPKHHSRTKKQEPASTSTAGSSKSGKGEKNKR